MPTGMLVIYILIIVAYFIIGLILAHAYGDDADAATIWYVLGFLGLIVMFTIHGIHINDRLKDQDVITCKEHVQAALLEGNFAAENQLAILGAACVS